MSVNVPETRGDYVHLWPHHQGGTLIDVCEQFIVRIDEQGVLD